MMGTSGAFIAVSVAALQQGGAALLATLVIASSLFQFLLAGRLSLLRRIITPTVAGTVIMLIAVNVMPFLFDFLDNVPPGSAPLAAPVTVLSTLAVTLGLLLRFTGPVRLWGPLIGIAAGCVAASFFGLMDTATLTRAAWIGVPAVTQWRSSGSPGGSPRPRTIARSRERLPPTVWATFCQGSSPQCRTRPIRGAREWTRPRRS